MNVIRLVMALGIAFAAALGSLSMSTIAAPVVDPAYPISSFVPLADDDDDGDDDSDDDDVDDDGGSSGGSNDDDNVNVSSGGDDLVQDDNSGSGSTSGGDNDDDSGQGRGRGRGGNDDFEIESELELAFDDVDGIVTDIVDDDNDDSTDGYRSLQAIVRLQPGASIEEFNGKHGTATIAAYASRDLYLLQLPADLPQLEVERALALDPETRWAELNFISQAPEGRPGYFFVSGAPGAPALLDESYAPALLGYTQAQTCETGAGVKIAVLDTGIDATHPLLAGRIADGGWNALANSAETADAGNGRDDDGDSLVDEMVGHGTHVAGIIAAVAPDAMILPVKVLSSDGAGDAFFIAAGIHYAVDQRVQVINLSLGSTYDSRVIAEAVAEAAEAGVVVVAAAGNASTDRPIEFPAANAGVISVAATDAADLKSSFSNFGAQVDLSAPGVDIASALPGGQIGTWSGTSMSAPFVSGTAALVAQAHPSWSAPQITTRLLRTSSDLDTLNPDFAGELGAGRLDVDAAVRCEPDQVAIANR